MKNAKARKAGCFHASRVLAVLLVSGAPAPRAALADTAVQAEVVPLPPTEAHPTWVRKADKGFFDDAVALNPEAHVVAVIRTDSASFAHLELFDLSTKEKVNSIALGDPNEIYERIVFPGPDRSVVLVVRDGKSGQRLAQRFDEAGKPAGVIGPATQIGFTSRAGKPFAVKWDRLQKKGRTQYAVAAVDLADLSVVGKPKVLMADLEDRLTAPALRVLAWTDGQSRLFGQEPGGYDKTKDVRMPDRAALFDLLRGEIVWRGEITDVMGWGLANQLRQRRPGRSAFADIAEDESRLELVDAMGARAPLGLRVPFEMYDPRSLIEREAVDPPRLAFSLTVDPLNPPALARKKADVPKLDLYQVALPEPGQLVPQVPLTAEHLLRVPMNDRPVGWTVHGSYVVILRKFKSFARGGDAFEVYTIR